MESAGHDVYIPQLPTPEGQSVENWDKALGMSAREFGKNTAVIGHSCGAAYLLHILQRLNKPIAKSVFVSGFAQKLGNDFDAPNKTFVECEFEWDRIKNNMGASTVFYGDNDPYVPRSAAEYLGGKLGVPITIIANGGHLNSESGFAEFHQLLPVLE
jgi:predicted alpha/beta hydrolase family esterase